MKLRNSGLVERRVIRNSEPSMSGWIASLIPKIQATCGLAESFDQINGDQAGE